MQVEGIERPSPPPTATLSEKKPRKRFVGTSARASSSRIVPRKIANQVPDDILHDPALKEAMRGLPSNYNFEIPKSIHHIRRDGVQTVALQMPEGLMIYGCAIADIIERFTGALPLLLADVTYGACCIDDYTAKEMGAEMIIHYGHSCLIPVSQTTLKTLYVFVEITIDTPHLCKSVRRNFPSSQKAFRRAILDSNPAEPGAKVTIALDESDLATLNGTPQPPSKTGENRDDEGRPTRLALVSTIQFVAAVQALKEDLEKALEPLEKVDMKENGEAVARVKNGEVGVWRGKYDIVVPQARPLSPGEVLGCTAPKLTDVDALIYVGDGRFHLESIMIANPQVPAFRFDPYSKKFTRETYEHDEMRSVRGDAVREARRGLGESGSGGWGVILGTLGRQGSLSVLKSITSSLPLSTAPPLLLLLSEMSPQKLSLIPTSEIKAFVQTSCPRLSIDWGYAFSRPLLSPYEASVAVGRVRGWGGLELPSVVGKGGEGGEGEKGEGDYPMDFYADNSLGPWTPRHKAVLA